MINKLFHIAVLNIMIPGIIFAQAQISVNMNFPNEVEAGKEFDVNLIIHKGALEEFSRFQQELPAGLTASSVNSGTADFNFDKQRVRFIWLKLPAQEQLEIAYRVKVNERLKGEFTVTGEFSYVENDERKIVNLTTSTVRILPSPLVAENLQVDVSEYASVIASEKTSLESRYDITCIRQTPYRAVAGNDIIVHLLVYKKSMNKFAKIEEQVPEGFEAKSMDSKDAIFTFKDGIAKFVWMNLPADPGFVISYRLIPSAGKTISDLAIKGQLSYIDEGRNIVVEIIQRDIDLSGVDSQNVDELLASLESGEAPPPPRVKEVIPEEKKEPVKEEEGKPVVTTETKPLTREAEKKYKDIPPILLLPVENGIYFRVQLAATHDLVDPVNNYKKYNFERPVKVEYHDGWYKYSIGSFEDYKTARDYRDMIVTRKGISDAFVIAYQNGQRLPVEEALKLSIEN